MKGLSTFLFYEHHREPQNVHDLLPHLTEEETEALCEEKTFSKSQTSLVAESTSQRKWLIPQFAASTSTGQQDPSPFSRKTNRPSLLHLASKKLYDAL